MCVGRTFITGGVLYAPAVRRVEQPLGVDGDQCQSVEEDDGDEFGEVWEVAFVAVGVHSCSVMGDR